MGKYKLKMKHLKQLINKWSIAYVDEFYIKNELFNMGKINKKNESKNKK